MVEHGQGPAPLVESGDRAHPVDQVGLFGRPPDHVQTLGLGPRGGTGRRRSSGLAGEAAFEVRRHALVVAVPGHRDHHVARAVVVAEEAPDVVGTEAPTVDCVPERVPPERVAGEQRGLPLLGHQVRRLVGVHQYLVEDHAALGVDIGGAQGGVPHDLAQDVEPEREVLGEQADVEGRVLLGGECVAVATDLVQRLGDGGGRHRRRPLEQEMLEEVRAPASSSDSSREPEPTQYATATERTSSMVSVTKRMPLGSTEASINGDASDREVGDRRRYCCCDLRLRRRPDRGRRARTPARPRRHPQRRAPRCQRPAPGAVRHRCRPYHRRHCRHWHSRRPNPGRHRCPTRRCHRRPSRLEARRPTTGRPCPVGRCRPRAPEWVARGSGRPPRC